MKAFLLLVASTVVYALGLSAAFGQAAGAEHIRAARDTAGGDWQEVADFFCIANSATTPSVDDPIIEPTQIFDNLYAIGRAGTVVYAITTTAGIILIDSGYAGQEETVLLAGMSALGLDPSDVEHVVIAHGHADHYGGAAYLQSRYGARVVMSAEDWEVAARPPPGRAPVPLPDRDLDAVDGEPIRLGDVAITPVLIPGHTPGSLGLIFPVRDGGDTHTVALFGGTILLSDRISDEGLRQYIRSLERFGAMAAGLGVDVEIQNHPLFDGMFERLERLSMRQAGAPHPFVLEEGSYERFTSVIASCTRAELARRQEP